MYLINTLLKGKIASASIITIDFVFSGFTIHEIVAVFTSLYISNT